MCVQASVAFLGAWRARKEKLRTSCSKFSANGMLILNIPMSLEVKPHSLVGVSRRWMISQPQLEGEAYGTDCCGSPAAIRKLIAALRVDARETAAAMLDVPPCKLDAQTVTIGERGTNKNRSRSGERVQQISQV